MASFGTWLFTRFKGEFVGRDANGNRYYQARSRRTTSLYPRKRWVIYNGAANPLSIAPEWYPWLQYQVDQPLEPAIQPWAVPQPPNETGTAQAYFPDGDERMGGRRPVATGDYQAWQPRA